MKLARAFHRVTQVDLWSTTSRERVGEEEVAGLKR